MDAAGLQLALQDVGVWDDFSGWVISEVGGLDRLKVMDVDVLRQAVQHEFLARKSLSQLKSGLVMGAVTLYATTPADAKDTKDAKARKVPKGKAFSAAPISRNSGKATVSSPRRGATSPELQPSSPVALPVTSKTSEGRVVPGTCACGVVTANSRDYVDEDLNALLENNRAWVKSVNTVAPCFFRSLAKSQAPNYLYIGCSDARVDPGKLFGLQQGELFVHRNIGNLCCNELSFLSVLEFAVGFLGVPHIIVCGHYDCGAVRNSLKRQDVGLLENWLRSIRNVHRIHRKELDDINQEEERNRRLVELNVIEQCLNVYKTAVVQRIRSEGKNKHGFRQPRIHGFTFDPADGVLHKMDIDFDKLKEDYAHIYDLY